MLSVVIVGEQDITGKDILTRQIGDDSFGEIKCKFANWLFAKPATWNMFYDAISGPDTLGMTLLCYS
jgi:hypothetical protein